MLIKKFMKNTNGFTNLFTLKQNWTGNGCKCTWKMVNINGGREMLPIILLALVLVPRTGHRHHICRTLLKKGVSKFLLDGEMMAYSKVQDRFMPFGTLKSSTNAVLSGDNSDLQPCFIVFDCLVVNNTCLQELTLQKRKEYLEKVVVGADPTRLRVQKHEVATSAGKSFDILR